MSVRLRGKSVEINAVESVISGIVADNKGRGLRGARLAAGVFQDFIPVIVKVGQLRQVRLLYVPRNCLTNKIRTYDNKQ